MTLSESNRLCGDLLDCSMEEEFIQFALCGIGGSSDGTTVEEGYQAMIDPIRNMLEDNHDLEVYRDYDSVLGLDFEIAVVGTPVTIFPVAMDSATLTTSVHISYDLESASGVSLDLASIIPFLDD
jgi:hypothetical protein